MDPVLYCLATAAFAGACASVALVGRLLILRYSFIPAIGGDSDAQ